MFLSLSKFYYPPPLRSDYFNLKSLLSFQILPICCVAVMINYKLFFLCQMPCFFQKSQLVGGVLCIQFGLINEKNLSNSKINSNYLFGWFVLQLSVNLNAVTVGNAFNLTPVDVPLGPQVPSAKIVSCFENFLETAFGSNVTRDAYVKSNP